MTTETRELKIKINEAELDGKPFYSWDIIVAESGEVRMQSPGGYFDKSECEESAKSWMEWLKN